MEKKNFYEDVKEFLTAIPSSVVCLQAAASEMSAPVNRLQISLYTFCVMKIWKGFAIIFLFLIFLQLWSV